MNLRIIRLTNHIQEHLKSYQNKLMFICRAYLVLLLSGDNLFPKSGVPYIDLCLNLLPETEFIYLSGLCPNAFIRVILPYDY